MFYARLMPDIRRTGEHYALNYMLDRAKTVADEHGGAPAAFNFGFPVVEEKIRKLGDAGILLERDKSQRDAVRDLLIPLLMDAVHLGYDIEHEDVFRALYVVACVMHSAEYVPMRVLGKTAEGMIKR